MRAASHPPSLQDWLASCGTDEVLKKAEDALEETPVGSKRMVPQSVTTRWATAVIKMFPGVFGHVDTKKEEGWEKKVFKARTPPTKKGGKEITARHLYRFELVGAWQPGRRLNHM